MGTEPTQSPGDGRLEDAKESWYGFLLVGLPVVALLGLYWYFVQRQVGLGVDDPAAVRGQFGDMFGGANALFSGLAFAGLIYTIHLQRRELALQRHELRMTREEISGQREQLERQSVIFAHQQFDTTFFQLLQLLSSIVEGLEVDRGTTTHTIGSAVFSRVQDRLSVEHPEYRTPRADRRIAAQQAYCIADNWAEKVLSPYFRSLYHIYKFIDQSRLTPADKKRYASFVRAQLSESELVVLFFNAQLPRASKFQPMIERYSLFEHLPVWNFDGADLKLYGEDAYGDNHEVLEHRRYS